MKRILLIVAAFLIVTMSAAQTFGQRHSKSDDNTKTGRGLVLVVSGITFTGAAILQTGNMYQVPGYNPNPGNPNTQTYNTQPFMQQTPRQLMLFVGIGLTVTGLITFMTHNQ